MGQEGVAIARAHRVACAGWLFRAAALLALLQGGAPGCSKGPLPAEAITEPTPAEPVEAAIHDGWDPGSGRGVVTVTTTSGDRIEIRLHDGFSGYTGGLVPGSQSGPAVRWTPAGAAEGDPPLALWCALDESFVVGDEELEYTYGWSENLGRGPDGVPLRYLGGAVLDDGPGGLLLRSENAALPLHVTRWMRVLPDGTLLFRVRATAVGDDPVHLDLWTGDDPWVGTYGSARGDVGWTAAGLVRHEQIIPPAPGMCLGIADPGDGEDALGRPVANAFCLGPGAPTPDRVYLANRFAHTDGEVDPARPLSGETMTAFNLGWTGRELAPGEAFEVWYATGAARWPAGAAAPEVPAIPDEAWAPLRAAEPPADLDAERVRDPVRFASERVVMEILPGGREVQIRGRYQLVNDAEQGVTRRIYFPFAVDEDHPYPTAIHVNTGRPERFKDGVVFPVAIPAAGETWLEVDYRQEARDAEATYIVTSARAWARPLDQAELVVVAPGGLEPAEISFPMEGPTTADGVRTWSTTLERFFPDREFTVSWTGAEGGD